MRARAPNAALSLKSIWAEGGQAKALLIMPPTGGRGGGDKGAFARLADKHRSGGSGDGTARKPNCFMVAAAAAAASAYVLTSDSGRLKYGRAELAYTHNCC